VLKEGNKMAKQDVWASASAVEKRHGDEGGDGEDQDVVYVLSKHDRDMEGSEAQPGVRALHPHLGSALLEKMEKEMEKRRGMWSADVCLCCLSSLDWMYAAYVDVDVMDPDGSRLGWQRTKTERLHRLLDVVSATR
jgi:hypothetical protein